MAVCSHLLQWLPRVASAPDAVTSMQRIAASLAYQVCRMVPPCCAPLHKDVVAGNGFDRRELVDREASAVAHANALRAEHARQAHTHKATVR